jgi:hypothetical protein
MWTSFGFKGLVTFGAFYCKLYTVLKVTTVVYPFKKKKKNLLVIGGKKNGLPSIIRVLLNSRYSLILFYFVSCMYRSHWYLLPV